MVTLPTALLISKRFKPSDENDRVAPAFADSTPATKSIPDFIGRDAVADGPSIAPASIVRAPSAPATLNKPTPVTRGMTHVAEPSPTLATKEAMADIMAMFGMSQHMWCSILYFHHQWSRCRKQTGAAGLYSCSYCHHTHSSHIVKQATATHADLPGRRRFGEHCTA
jgi:hypothetical protein